MVYIAGTKLYVPRTSVEIPVYSMHPSQRNSNSVDIHNSTINKYDRRLMAFKFDLRQGRSKGMPLTFHLTSFMTKNILHTCSFYSMECMRNV